MREMRKRSIAESRQEQARRAIAVGRGGEAEVVICCFVDDDDGGGGGEEE
jgi:hypothetical protein